MKEVHLTVRVCGHYYDIQHPKPSRAIGNIIILQLPDMDPIRMVSVPGDEPTGGCRSCPVYINNIPGLPGDNTLTCTNCGRTYEKNGYHYVNIDKALEDL